VPGPGFLVFLVDAAVEGNCSYAGAGAAKPPGGSCGLIGS
jgi:hypothetical protein